MEEDDEAEAEDEQKNAAELHHDDWNPILARRGVDEVGAGRVDCTNLPCTQRPVPPKRQAVFQIYAEQWVKGQSATMISPAACRAQRSASTRSSSDGRF